MGALHSLCQPLLGTVGAPATASRGRGRGGRRPAVTGLSHMKTNTLAEHMNLEAGETRGGRRCDKPLNGGQQITRHVRVP